MAFLFMCEADFQHYKDFILSSQRGYEPGQALPKQGHGKECSPRIKHDRIRKDGWGAYLNRADRTGR